MKPYMKIILCLIFLMSIGERVFALTLENDKDFSPLVRTDCYWGSWMGEPYYKFKNCYSYFGYGDGFCGTYRFQKAF